MNTALATGWAVRVVGQILVQKKVKVSTALRQARRARAGATKSAVAESPKNAAIVALEPQQVGAKHKLMQRYKR